MIDPTHGTFACMGALMGAHISCYGLLFLLTTKKQTIFVRYSTNVAKCGHPVRIQLDCVAKH
jgi:hypothetical protein